MALKVKNGLDSTDKKRLLQEIDNLRTTVKATPPRKIRGAMSSMDQPHRNLEKTGTYVLDISVEFDPKRK